MKGRSQEGKGTEAQRHRGTEAQRELGVWSQKFWLLASVFCLLSSVFCLLAGVVFSNTFTLKEEVEVVGKEILLSDISDYSGDDIKIGVAPLPGKSRVLKGQYIKLVAKRKIPEIEITGDEVRVTRACQSLPKERIIEEITRAIDEKAEIIVGKIPDLVLPKGELIFEIEPVIKGDEAICKVQILVNGDQFKKIRVGCKIKRFGDVAVAKKDLQVGSLIKADDIEMAYKEIEKEAGFSCATDLVGKETRVLIKAGEIVREDDVREQVLVRFGDTVTIIKNGDGFTVSCEGKAASNGFLGKRIMVRNPSSNKLIEGVVLDSKTVEVR
ncbi:MAG: flagellar basal body P-ring formation chaperone FlgA [Candidatus Desantisbacteria bacterium]